MPRGVPATPRIAASGRSQRCRCATTSSLCSALTCAGWHKRLASLSQPLCHGLSSAQCKRKQTADRPSTQSNMGRGSAMRLGVLRARTVGPATGATTAPRHVAAAYLHRRGLPRKHAAGAVQQLRQLPPRDGRRAVVHVRKRVQHLHSRPHASRMTMTQRARRCGSCQGRNLGMNSQLLSWRGAKLPRQLHGHAAPTRYIPV